MVVSMLLARHGETPDNAHGLILGHRDPPLSQAGREQSTRLAGLAERDGVAAIWCSPLLRARQTAAAVASAIHVEPTVLEDLIESDRGSWEGQRVQDISARTPALFAAFEAAEDGFAFPEGESLAHQVARTRRALTLVAGGPEPALVVAHAGTIRAALIAVGRRPPPERALGHGEVVRVSWPVDHADANATQAPATEAAGTGSRDDD